VAGADASLTAGASWWSLGRKAAWSASSDACGAPPTLSLDNPSEEQRHPAVLVEFLFFFCFIQLKQNPIDQPEG
jgi:hypothetical protein